MNKILIFTAGVAVGGIGGYFVAKRVMRKKTEDEIQSVKDAFKQIAEEEKQQMLQTNAAEAKVAMENYGGTADSVAVDISNIDMQKAEESPIIRKEEGKTAAEMDATANKPHLEPKTGEPYCITPDEYGEGSYEIDNLTYYADGVLAYDDTGEIVRHPDEVVGRENLYHFGEFEPEMLYVRDPVKSVDYAIQLCEEKYHDRR